MASRRKGLKRARRKQLEDKREDIHVYPYLSPQNGAKKAGKRVCIMCQINLSTSQAMSLCTYFCQVPIAINTEQLDLRDSVKLSVPAAQEFNAFAAAGPSYAFQSCLRSPPVRALLCIFHVADPFLLLLYPLPLLPSPPGMPFTAVFMTAVSWKGGAKSRIGLSLSLPLRAFAVKRHYITLSGSEDGARLSRAICRHGPSDGEPCAHERGRERERISKQGLDRPGSGRGRAGLHSSGRQAWIC